MSQAREAFIGIITPNAQGSLQPEAIEIFEGRVRTTTRGISVQQLSLPGYEAALARLPDAVDSLVDEGVEAIVINGTSLSFAFGREFHDDLVATVQARSGLPVTTMAASLVDALVALRSRRVILATAYDEDVTGRLAEFLKSHGIAAEVGDCLGIVENAKLRLLQKQDIVDLAERAAKGREMDSLVISCGNLRTIPLTVELESRFRVPVVSSALVGVWGALRIAGFKQSIPGTGRLFELKAA